MTDNQVTELALKCDNLKRERSFVTSSLSEEESNFPLAYSILVYRDAEQVLNLLSAIYRPQNFYCIHVDAKAKRSYRQAIAAIADCFPNVFLSSRSVDVRWGRFSVLEPELVCMQDLWNYTHWKYFINLTGQEFPLKTNYELVKILTAYNGANDVRATPSCHVSKDIQRWCNITGVPDETFFPSLNHNPKLGIKGSFTAKPKYNQPYMARYKQWTSNKYSPNRVPSCAGQKFVYTPIDKITTYVEQHTRKPESPQGFNINENDDDEDDDDDDDDDYDDNDDDYENAAAAATTTMMMITTTAAATTTTTTTMMMMMMMMISPVDDV
nr:hypothetical protein BaRGS_017775 [Batillaria attramentaria]